MLTKSIAQQKVLIYDPERCTGCRYCEIACSFKNFNTIDFEKCHLHITFDETTGRYESVYCLHCEEPVCAASCPKEAITKDEEMGWITINPLKCIGCKTCTFSCPLSAPWFNDGNRISMKCNFCDGNPVCAMYCSPGALRVVTRKEAWDLNRKTYGQKTQLEEA